MSKIPKRFTEFMKAHPEVADAYGSMSRAVSAAGPLDAKTCALVKIGIGVGARIEGGVRSHARKALEAGATPDEVRHAVMQALTTVGLPTMMAGMSWVEEAMAE